MDAAYDAEQIREHSRSLGQSTSSEELRTEARRGSSVPSRSLQRAYGASMAVEDEFLRPHREGVSMFGVDPPRLVTSNPPRRPTGVSHPPVSRRSVDTSTPCFPGVPPAFTIHGVKIQGVHPENLRTEPSRAPQVAYDSILLSPACPESTVVPQWPTPTGNREGTAAVASAASRRVLS